MRSPRPCLLCPTTATSATSPGSDRGPEELVPSSERWSTPGAEGDLELLAEEQILNEEALTAADGGDEGGQEEPDKFEHQLRGERPRRGSEVGRFTLQSRPTCVGPS